MTTPGLKWVKTVLTNPSALIRIFDIVFHQIGNYEIKRIYFVVSLFGILLRTSEKFSRMKTDETLTEKLLRTFKTLN